MDITKCKLITYQKENNHLHDISGILRLILDENNNIIEDAIIDEIKLVHLYNLPSNVLLNPKLYLGNEYRIEYFNDDDLFKKNLNIKMVKYRLISWCFNKESEFYKQLIEQFPIIDKNVSI